MTDDTGRRLDIRIVQAVEGCAERCVDDLLHRLAEYRSAPTLRSRRQALIERTTTALLRIVGDETR